MFCRAGSPESCTLAPQAVLWTANDVSLSKLPVPRRTCVCVPLIEIHGALVRLSWCLILSKYRTWSCIQLHQRSHPILDLPHKYFKPQAHRAIWNAFGVFDPFLSPSFHSHATITKMSSHVYIIFTKPWVIAFQPLHNNWENMELFQVSQYRIPINHYQNLFLWSCDVLGPCDYRPLQNQTCPHNLSRRWLQVSCRLPLPHAKHH